MEFHNHAIEFKFRNTPTWWLCLVITPLGLSFISISWRSLLAWWYFIRRHMWGALTRLNELKSLLPSHSCVQYLNNASLLVIKNIMLHIHMSIYIHIYVCRYIISNKRFKHAALHKHTTKPHIWKQLSFHLLKSKNSIGDNENAYPNLKCYNRNILVQKMVLLNYTTNRRCTHCRYTPHRWLHH